MDNAHGVVLCICWILDHGTDLCPNIFFLHDGSTVIWSADLQFYYQCIFKFSQVQVNKMDDIEIRLKYLASKWKNANPEIHDICRDAAEEIRVLRTQKSVTDSLTDSIINHYNYGSGWGKGKDE